MIYVIGSGYVGSHVIRELNRRGLMYAVFDRRTTSAGDLRKALSQLPSLVINAAGHVGKPNVDACEKQQGDLMKGNVVLPALLSSFCELYGIPLIHFSSGCVYHGRREDGSGWREEDAPNFTQSLYSLSKALGEEQITCNAWTVRIRLPFSDDNDPRSLLSKFRNYPMLLPAENSISHVGDAVKSALDLWRLRAPYGIYHATNPDAISHMEIVKMMGLEKKWGDWEEFYLEGHAPRSNCVLDTTKLSAISPMRPVREALRDAIAAL